MRHGIQPAAALVVAALIVGCAGQAATRPDVQQLEARIQELEARIAEMQAQIEELTRTLRPIQALEELVQQGLQQRFEGVSDRARIGAAKAELATIKQGLGMFQAESDDSAYPGTADISSYADLRNTVSPYVRIARGEDAAYTFVAYTSAKPDTFVLLAKARDSARTLITVTPTVITP
ncbi:hypothetical protein ACFL4Y_04190 [Gemmatimonadota bacterium]